MALRVDWLLGGSVEKPRGALIGSHFGVDNVHIPEKTVKNLALRRFCTQGRPLELILHFLGEMVLHVKQKK